MLCANNEDKFKVQFINLKKLFVSQSNWGKDLKE
jgi:hypothetical protein